MRQLAARLKHCFSTDFFYDVGIFLLLHLSVAILMASIGFLIKVPISAGSFFCGLLMSILVLYGLFRSKRTSNRLFAVLLVGISILIVSVCVSGVWIDNSTDGNSFIKPAIGFLKYGWNPIYESVSDFIKDFSYLLPDNILEGEDWINCYPKASWIYGAYLYALTGNIESGKAMAFLVFLACFFITIHMVKRFGTTTSQAVVISLVMHLNPITFKHMITFYMDGMLSNLFCLLLLLLAYITLHRKRGDREILLIEACVIFLCGTLKFTGLAFAAIFSFIFYILWIYYAIKEKDTLLLKKMTVYYILVVLVTVVIAGSNSYIKNLILYTSPVYPLTMDTAAVNCPTVIADCPNIVKNVIMMFTRSSNYNGTYPLELKIPFTMNFEEFASCTARNTMRGDFGPLFSGCFLVSLVFVLLELPRFKKKAPDHFCVIITYLTILVLNSFIFDNVWHYRYHPYVYGVIVLAAWILLQKKSKICFALLFTVFLNLSFYSMNHLFSFRANMELQEIIAEAKKVEYIELQADYLVSLNPVGLAFNMIDQDIDYKFVHDISDTPMYKNECACISYRYNLAIQK